MSIAKKKAEILKLIARVNHGSADAPPKTKPGRAALARKDRPSSDPKALSAEIKRVLSSRADAGRRRGARELAPRRAIAEARDASLVERVSRLEHRLDEILGYLMDQPRDAPPPRAASSAEPAALSAGEENWTFAGVLQEGILADMLQLVSSNVMTGVFCVVGDGDPIEMFFHEGELLHAASAGLEGESAFFAAMATERGRYYFRETKQQQPPKKTISNKTQFLILEALRQIDEARAS